MTAHNFAHNVKENLCSRSMFWDYKDSSKNIRRIYSYGRHFCIAIIDEVARVCLFTTRGYSNTTARHINEVSYAIRGLDYNIIYCYDPDGLTAGNIESYAAQIVANAKSFSRSRIHGAFYLDKIKETYKNACEYREYFKLKKRDFAPVEKVYNTFNAENAAESVKTILADQEKARKREEAKRLKEERRRAAIAKMKSTERVQMWENGENVFLNWTDTDENVPLRVKGKKGYFVIETGRGVNVPLIEAQRVAGLVLSGSFEGLTVNGVYNIREYNAEYVQIGCHRFNMDYLRQFANKVLTL